MSNLTIFNIEEQIKTHQQALVELNAQLVLAQQENPEYQLAKELHGMQCHWNHTDGCSWFYEIKNKVDDWSGSAHGTYLKKAQSLIHKCKQVGVTVDQAMTIAKIVEGR